VALLTINDTDTGVWKMGASGGISTNAQIINAGTSGGLVMEGGDSVAVAIFGSTTKSNVLIGSPFADNLNGGSATDSIVTNGGGDGVNLGAGHTADLIGLYVASGGSFVAPGSAPPDFVTAAITDATDHAQPGFWGVVPGGTPIVPTTAFANTGTSASMAVVNGFVAASDTVDFAGFPFPGVTGTGEWENASPFFGLQNIDLASISQIGVARFSNPVIAGGAITGPAGFDVGIITTQFANAAQLAATLHTVGLAMPTALPGGEEVHLLFAYQDLTGNTRIADVDWLATGAASMNLNTNAVVAASDMVELAGVSLASLTNSNVHFVM
jgi:hypothetical protein